MNDTIFSETVFDYDITKTERTMLNVQCFDNVSYFQDTSYQKRLSDLHFLFLIRKDVYNRSRILNLIKQLDKLERVKIFDQDSVFA